MNPRPYQNDFIHSVAKGFADGYMRQLGVLPTGGGKTICFAHIANRFHVTRGERTLVLAHRQELLHQAADKIEKATGLGVTMERAEDRGDRKAPVVVASVQTMRGKRLESWDPDHFGLIVCDEAHHVLADSWQSTLAHFNARILGVTATPDRGDKRQLSKFFENLAYECSIIDLIRDKYLSPLLIQSVPIQIDLRFLRQTGGDYDSKDLDAAITPWLREIVAHIRDKCPERKRIAVFLPLVSTSKRFVELCVEAGISAAHIDGDSPDRVEILTQYSEGRYRVIANAMLLTEGWDEPAVDCVIVLRPTKSRSLLAQMVGRGTRLAPGKENCLFLDFLWLHERHDLARPASLIARSVEEEESITRILADSKDDKDLSEAMDEAAAEREAALIREIAAKARRKERFIPIEDVAALLKDLKMREYSPTFAWEKDAPTEKQRALLEKFRIKCPATKGEAKILMDRVFSRSKGKLVSIAQLQWLYRLNHPSPDTATAAEAKAFLDQKWKKNS